MSNDNAVIASTALTDRVMSPLGGALRGSMEMQGLNAAVADPPRAHGPRRHAIAAQTPSPPQRSSGLDCSVLVLNRLYMAVHVVNVRRAIGLLCCGMAEVVHYEEGTFAAYSFDSWLEISELRAENKLAEDDWIRSVNFEVQVPRVIRLLRYDRLPKQKVHLNRRNVLARDGHICQYCGRRFATQSLSIDHVFPRSRGGETTWENVVCACLTCNVKKGGRTPKEAHMKLINRPVRPKRSPMLSLKLNNPKYESWRTWLDSTTWDVGGRGE